MTDAPIPALKVEALAAKDTGPSTCKTVSFSIGNATAEVDLLDLQMFLNQLPNLRPGSGQRSSLEFPAPAAPSAPAV